MSSVTPSSAPTFADLGVPADLAHQLTSRGITEPTPIQAAAMPDAIAGRDVAGRAPTGSGKTLAFGIPLALNVSRARANRPTALVLAPTRELAQQIADAIRPLVKLRGGDVAAVFGGVGYGPQRKALAAGVSVLVACPGRLEDLISMGAVDLGDVRQLVIDEADRMADMGFLPAVKRIVQRTHAERQTLLFSATFDGATGKALAGLQQRPIRHDVDPGDDDVSAAHHVFWRLDRGDRTEWTAKVVQAAGSTMVFCRTRHGADRLARQLARHGVSAAPIHGGRSQPQRDRALKAFTDGTVTALVATDVAARGVHVDDVAAVVHFDPPADAATYVHRSGRTARAGAGGVVVSLVEPEAERDTLAMKRTAGIEGAISAPSLAHLTASPADPATRPARPAPRPSDNGPARAERRTPAKPARGTSSQQKSAPAEAEPAPRRSPKPTHDVATVRTSPSATAGHRRAGTVRYFHKNRGFGFIAPDEGADVFVHHTSITRTVRRGERVEFALRESPKGLEAVDVSLI